MTDKKNVELICRQELGRKSSVTTISSSVTVSSMKNVSPSKLLKNRKCVAIMQNRGTERQIIAGKYTVQRNYESINQIIYD